MKTLVIYEAFPDGVDLYLINDDVRHLHNKFGNTNDPLDKEMIDFPGKYKDNLINTDQTVNTERIDYIVVTGYIT